MTAMKGGPRAKAHDGPDRQCTVYLGPKANFGGLVTHQISLPGVLPVGPYAAKPAPDWPLAAQTRANAISQRDANRHEEMAPDENGPWTWFA